MNESAEWLARAQAHREWAQTEIGKLFVAYEHAHANAWRLDTEAGYEDHGSNQRLTEAWEKQGAARRALVKAIGGPE